MSEETKSQPPSPVEQGPERPRCFLVEHGLPHGSTWMEVFTEEENARGYAHDRESELHVKASVTPLYVRADLAQPSLSDEAVPGCPRCDGPKYKASNYCADYPKCEPVSPTDAAIVNAFERAAHLAHDVAVDALDKLGYVTGNVAFENGRSKAAMEIEDAIRALATTNT